MEPPSPMALMRQPRVSGEDLLKEYILLRNLGPGDRLPPENELAAELGASRNVVREALRALQALGIVEIKHGLGAYVREATLSSLTSSLAFFSRLAVRDGREALYPIAEVREVLEINLLDKVIGLHTDEDWVGLEATVTAMSEAATQGERAPKEDRRFHELLYGPLDNWVLIYLIRAFWDTYVEVGQGSPRERRSPQVIVDQHIAILDALRKNDLAAARAAMLIHFDNHLRR